MYHDSFDQVYKKPFGAVRAGTNVYLRMDVDRKYKSCRIRFWTPEQREEIYDMNFVMNCYEKNLIVDKLGVSWYIFMLEDFDGNFRFYGCDQGYTGGRGCDYNYFPRKSGFQITCYDRNFSVPEWTNGNILYQIFPDRFHRDSSYKFMDKRYKKIHKSWGEPLSHTDGGADNFEFYAGNIKGITGKLDYLKELSVGIVYLNPIYQSVSNHRYDVASFMDMDEMLGTEGIFKEFTEACHQQNIKVLLDVSWNHVGADSIYFNKYKTFGSYGAYNDVHSVYRDWFDIQPDGTYTSWWGIDTLPVINKGNPSFRFYVGQVVEHWLSLGIDGFRLDVIDELPDDFLQWFRSVVKNINKDALIIGETWEDASMKKDWRGNSRSFLYGTSQDGVMNYPLRNMLIDFFAHGQGEKETIHYNIDAHTFYRKYMNLYNNYPREIFFTLMNFLSTHDINRALLMFGNCPYNGNLTKVEQNDFVLSEQEYELATKRFKLAWSFIICSIGIPSLFYGDETGLYGYNDPFNRKPMNWGKEDQALLTWVKEINQFRSLHPVLKFGEMKFIFAHGDVIAFERYDGNHKIVYIANRDPDSRTLHIGDYDLSVEGHSYKIEIVK